MKWSAISIAYNSDIFLMAGTADVQLHNIRCAIVILYVS